MKAIVLIFAAAALFLVNDLLSRYGSRVNERAHHRAKRVHQLHVAYTKAMVMIGEQQKDIKTEPVVLGYLERIRSEAEALRLSDDYPVGGLIRKVWFHARGLEVVK